DLLEPRDQQLDPRVVGQDQGRGGVLAAEQPAQDRIEEEHRVRAERSVGPARLQEMDRGSGQAAELDLAGDPLDELVPLLVAPLPGQAHTATVPPTVEPDAGPTGPGPDGAARAA